LGGVLARQNIPVFAHLFGAALLLGLVGAIVARYLPPQPVGTLSPPDSTEGQEQHAPVFVIPPRALWAVGMIAGCSFLAEGAMADWSAVFLNREQHVDAGMAATGYAVFSFAMAAGRFVGDPVVHRIGPQRAVRFGGAIAAGALGAALIVNQPWATIAGLACIGAGLSVIVPVAFSAAGNTPGISHGRAIAAAATAGYSGYLLGPPVIGFVAEALTLRGALAIVALLCLTISVLAKSVSRAGAAGM